MALTDRKIADYEVLTEKASVVVSTQTIGRVSLPGISGFILYQLDPDQIQEMADRNGPFFYLRFNTLNIGEDSVIVNFQNAVAARATLGSKVVGFVISFKDALCPNYIIKKKIGHIQVVHVKREFRRSGIAAKLVNAAFRYLKVNGCSIILAKTGDVNTK